MIKCIILALPVLLFGQEIDLKVVEKFNDELIGFAFSINVKDIAAEDILPKYAKIIGYEYEIEQEVYSGPGSTLTLKAERIWSYDLIHLLNLHMAPQKNMTIDYKNKKIIFKNK